jgi:hypothetical protein
MCREEMCCIIMELFVGVREILSGWLGVVCVQVEGLTAGMERMIDVVAVIWGF